MSLTMISAAQDYVVYEDGDGDEIVQTRGPLAVPLVWWEDVDLESAWFAAVQNHRQNPPPNSWSYRPNRANFVAQVRQSVADHESVEIVWCESCEEPVKGDAVERVNGDEYACSGCFEEYYRSCDDCGNVVHYENLHYTLAEENVCLGCLNGNYSHCEECDGYYHDSYSEDHSHGGCDCEPPTLDLTMPNGDGTLSRDERVTVTLPSGVISEEGIHSIVRLVRNHYYTVCDTDSEIASKWWSLSYDIGTLDPRWQTKEGNFTKRLSKLAHKNQGLKFPPELLTKVGNIARDNSQGASVNLELTRNLNMSAEDFYHEDSCWWQSYSESRCALKSNGGIGMRTFDDRGRVSGRAWIMPLRVTEDGGFVPTFDGQAADAFMVFNGYGDLSGYTPARILAGMVGLTYRKVGFDCSPMYVNGNAGYLVSSEEVAAKYGTHVNLYVDTHSNLHHNEQTRELIAA